MKKTVKPVFKVDLTDCNTVEDIYAAFGSAKQKAGVPVMKIELRSIIHNAVEEALNNARIDIAEGNDKKDTINVGEWKAFDINDDEKMIIKQKNGKVYLKKVKKNIFKRFWCWLRRK